MENLKLLRKKRGLSQKAFADIFNASQNTISQWESGKREPNYETTQKIADYFNVSVDYLLGHNYSPGTSENDDPQLTSRDKKQIEDILENTKQQLLSQDGLMFEGSPATEEDVQKVLMALQMGMEMIKKENKEKYTPKKYRK